MLWENKVGLATTIRQTAYVPISRSSQQIRYTDMKNKKSILLLKTFVLNIFWIYFFFFFFEVLKYDNIGLTQWPFTRKHGDGTKF